MAAANKEINEGDGSSCPSVEEEEEEDPDPADRWMSRGQFLRQLRELEQQDEAERAAADVASDDDSKQANNHKIDGSSAEPQEDEIKTLSTGEKVLRYESFLAHQRYYDDLKHVDCKYIDYGYFAGTKSRLVIEQDKSLGKGGLCWDAAFILGEYLTKHSIPTTTTKLPIRAIELGCGTGLAGLMVGKAVPNAHVVLTDLPELMPLLRRNIDRNDEESSNTNHDGDVEAVVKEYINMHEVVNDFKGTVSASVLCWGDKEQEARYGTYDIVFGADVVATLYDPVALAETIWNLSHIQTTVYISFKERLSRIHRQFEDSMKEKFGMIDILQSHGSRNCNPQVHILVARDKKDTL